MNGNQKLRTLGPDPVERRHDRFIHQIVVVPDHLLVFVEYKWSSADINKHGRTLVTILALGSEHFIGYRPQVPRLPKNKLFTNFLLTFHFFEI